MRSPVAADDSLPAGKVEAAAAADPAATAGERKGCSMSRAFHFVPETLLLRLVVRSFVLHSVSVITGLVCQACNVSHVDT